MTTDNMIINDASYWYQKYLEVKASKDTIQNGKIESTAIDLAKAALSSGIKPASMSIFAADMVELAKSIHAEVYNKRERDLS